MQTWKRKLEGKRPTVEWDQLVVADDNELNWETLSTEMRPISHGEWTTDYTEQYVTVELTPSEIIELHRLMMENDGVTDRPVPSTYQIPVARSRIR